MKPNAVWGYTAFRPDWANDPNGLMSCIDINTSTSNFAGIILLEVGKIKCDLDRESDLALTTAQIHQSRKVFVTLWGSNSV